MCAGFAKHNPKKEKKQDSLNLLVELPTLSFSFLVLNVDVNNPVLEALLTKVVREELGIHQRPDPRVYSNQQD